MATVLDEYMTRKNEKICWYVGEATEWTNPDTKMRRVYTALREVICQEPVYQTTDSETRIPIIHGYGGQEQFGLQVFQWKGSMLVIEYVLDDFFGDGVKRIEGNSRIMNLKLKLLNPEAGLERIISKIVRKNI